MSDQRRLRLTIERVLTESEGQPAAARGDRLREALVECWPAGALLVCAVLRERKARAEWRKERANV